MKTKVIKGIRVDYNSTNPKDFIDVLNEVSPQIEGVTNLGVFADITKITPMKYLVNEVEEHFVNVCVSSGESPYKDLVNDGSPSKPYDHPFYELLNGAKMIEMTVADGKNKENSIENEDDEDEEEKDDE